MVAAPGTAVPSKGAVLLACLEASEADRFLQLFPSLEEEGSVVVVRRQRVVVAWGFALTFTRTLQFLGIVSDGVETDSGVHPGVVTEKKTIVLCRGTPLVS